MLRILDEDFKILETITEDISVEFVKVLNDYGTFTAQIPLAANPKEIQKNRILQHKHNYGVIRYIAQSDGYIVIQGHDLKSLLNQRCIQNSRSGISETVIKEYVAEALNGEGRNFHNFIISEDQGRGIGINYEIKGFKMADDAIREICGKNDWGYDITVDNSTMIFDMCVPRYLNVIYSKRHENIKEYEYIYDALEERNAVMNYAKWEGLEIESNYTAATAVVKAGRGYFSNGEDFKIETDVTVSTYTQHSSSYTTYIYAQKSISNGFVNVTISSSPLYNTSATLYSLIGTISSGGVVRYGDRYTIIAFSPFGASGVERREIATNYSGTYEEIEEACLAEITGTIAESVEAEILTTGDYRTKWNLGDFVKVCIRVMGGEITVTKQITQVTEIYEANSHKVVPVFGPIRETAFKKLARGRL